MFILETEKENESIVFETGIQNMEGVSSIKSMGFMGGTEMLQLAIAVTPVIITSLASVIIALKGANKKFSLKVKGNEISFENYTPDEIERFLLQYSKGSMFNE